MWVEEVLLAKVCQNLAVRSFVLWRVPNLGRRSQIGKTASSISWISSWGVHMGEESNG